MNNEITIFENPEFGKVRTVIVDNEPWFVGRDICNVFGDKNSSRSLGRIDAEDKRIINILDLKNRSQTATFVNESGLYSLLFAMQPQKANHDGVSDAYPIEVQKRIEKLHKFKRWVTSEVLPSIRKTGKYEIKNNPAIEKLDSYSTVNSYMIENPIERAKRWIEEQEEKIALENKIKADEPLVEFAKHVTETSDLIDIGMLSKVAKNENINIGRNKLFEWLRDNGYLMSRGIHKNEPYQKWIDKGYFELKEYSYKTAYGESIGFKTYVTGKGQIYIIEELRKYFGE